MRTLWSAVTVWQVLLAIALQACVPIVNPSGSPDPRFDLHVDNGTTLAITIVLNDHDAVQVPPSTTSVVSLRNEHVGIVSVKALLPNGRTVLSFAVDPRSLGSTTTGSETNVTGAAHRVDLSCGRLDIWLLTPPLGPVPGQGTPGDCGQAAP